MKLLVLGDSYTIGEGVPLTTRWPSVLAASLKLQGRSIDRITYIAKTGWTTGELLAALEKTHLHLQYNAVFLLIGVNNQYRGLSVEEYAHDVECLLEKAIAFAGGNREHVFVLSIPDWGLSPFAEDQNTTEIAGQIDQFNTVNAATAHRFNCKYIDICSISRRQSDPKYFTSDNLHPSPLAYDEWVQELLPPVRKILE